MHPLTVHETIQRMHQKYLETETPTVYTLEEVSDRVLLIKEDWQTWKKSAAFA